MDISSLIIFAFALLVAAGLPGPSLAALVARVIVRGWRDVLPFVSAMWIGELIWLTLAIAGLATIAETFHWPFLILKYCGVAYLIYLAWQMWTAPVEIETEGISLSAGGAVRMFLAGLAVTLGNPKIMVFYLALLPTIIDIGSITIVGWAKLSSILLLILAAVDIAYIALATRARSLMHNPSAVRLANRVGATVMGGAATVIATR